jgi:hypothetical protein
MFAGLGAADGSGKQQQDYAGIVAGLCVHSVVGAEYHLREYYRALGRGWTE